MIVDVLVDAFKREKAWWVGAPVGLFLVSVIAYFERKDAEFATSLPVYLIGFALLVAVVFDILDCLVRRRKPTRRMVLATTLAMAFIWLLYFINGDVKGIALLAMFVSGVFFAMSLVKGAIDQLGKKRRK